MCGYMFVIYGSMSLEPNAEEIKSFLIIDECVLSALRGKKNGTMVYY
jgi:hypothetical protein